MNEHKIIGKVIALNRRVKVIIIAFLDFFVSLGSFVAAFLILRDTLPSTSNDEKLVFIILGISVFAVFLFYLQGLYKDIFRYVGLHSIMKLTIGVFISGILLFILIQNLLGFGPKRLAMLYMMTFGIVIVSIRMFARIILNDFTKRNLKADRVLIYGAGHSGHQILYMMKNSMEYKPVGFLDDDAYKQGLKIDGLNIFLGVEAPLIAEKLNVDTILLAMPSASRSKRRAIVLELEECGVKVKTLPHINDIMDGSAAITDIQNVDITELLGREPVAPNQNLFSKYIKNQNVMVTGGAGSIGSELCRQILKNQPSQLIIMDSSEYSLYAIEQELSQFIEQSGQNIELIPILGSVQSKPRLASVFAKYRIDTIYHAAAYKHVPLVELNVMEGVTNNIFGTLNVAQLAIEFGVNQFTLISTDKAVRPTNVMGASKRMAELVLQSLANEAHSTCFSMVRFGNVLGSSGSVVPLFTKQIEQGGPITVTDPNIIRYFMTIPEAAQLVIQAGAMAKGGEVYVLDMGEPVLIYDLACQMVSLADLTIRDAANPDGDIEITFTGLRPGEKLYEELLFGDKVIETDHKRILAAKEECMNWRDFEQVLQNVQKACDLYDVEYLHQIFSEAPVGYNHSDEYIDLVDLRNDLHEMEKQLSQSKSVGA